MDCPANALTTCSQNAGRSSGFRLVTRVFGPFVQTCTSASTQLPAALRGYSRRPAPGYRK